MATVTKPIAKDESLNTTETPSRNIADVLAEELEGIKNAIGGGGGSGGHTIITPDGTMTQRSNLNFTDAHGTDNSANNETEITVFKHIMQADFNNLTPTQQNTGGYIIDDANPSYIPANNCVSVTADGVKTVSQLLDEIYANMDMSKVSRNAILMFNSTYYYLTYKASDWLRFATMAYAGGGSRIIECTVESSGSVCRMATASTVQNISTDVYPDGIVFTLYYNIVATEVEHSEITAKPSDIFTPESGILIHDDTIQQIKIGRMVQLMFSVKQQNNADFVFSNARTKLGTLASGWRPTSYIMTPTSGSDSPNSYTNQLVANLVIVPTDGSVNIDKANNLSAFSPHLEQIYITVSYISEA